MHGITVGQKDLDWGYSMANTFDEKVEELQKKTSFSEDVCGCYLSNFGTKNICPVATGGWCKDLMKCKVLAQIGG